MSRRSFLALFMMCAVFYTFRLKLLGMFISSRYAATVLLEMRIPSPFSTFDNASSLSGFFLFSPAIRSRIRSFTLPLSTAASDDFSAAARNRERKG